MTELKSWENDDMTDLEKAQAELAIMRARHREEAKPLQRQVNRLMQATIRSQQKRFTKEALLEEQLAAGEIYSNDPALLARGAKPLVRSIDHGAESEPVQQSDEDAADAEAQVAFEKWQEENP